MKWLSSSGKRADKLAEISTEQVRQQQQARLSPEEQRSLERLQHNSLEHKQNVPHEISRAHDSLQYAKDHLFERSSVVYYHELLTEALRHGRGQINLGQLRGLLQVEQSQGMVALIDKNIDQYPRLGGTHEFHTGEHLRDEQNAQFRRFLVHAILPSTCVVQPEPAKQPHFRKLIAGFAKPGAM